MRKLSLDALAREHLERAASGSTSLTEHDSPGEATLIVLRGRARLHADDDTWEGRTGDLLVIPPARHSLDAVEDSVILLTVAK